MDFQRLARGTTLSVDQVATFSRREGHEVVRAIESRQLRAKQVKGEWTILVEDMRSWLSRR
jgi:subtilisin-like proprotein convertase family protein